MAPLKLFFADQVYSEAVRWWLILGIVAAYALSAALVIRMYVLRADAPFVYIAAGVLWAGLLLTTKREWAALIPLVLATQLSLDLSVYGASLPEALIYSGSKVAEACAGVVILQMLVNHDPGASPLFSVAKFIIVAGIVCPAVFALPPAYVRAETGLSIALEWAQWALVQASGSVVVAPVFLALHAFAKRETGITHRRREAVAVSIVLVGTSYAVFLGAALEHPASIYLSTPAIFWAATRFGVAGAAAGNAVITIFASIGQISGSVYFLPTTSPQDIGASLCLFLSVNSMASLLLGASADDSEMQGNQLRNSQTQMRQLAINSNRKEDEFRTKTAELIHDSMGQMLALGRIRLDMLASKFADNDPFKDELKGLNDVFKEAIAISRSITSGVASSVYTGGSLGAAMDNLTDALITEYNIKSVVRYHNVPELDRHIATNVFRCAREVLVNVIKHANASNVELDIYHDSTWLRITIIDDGEGFDVTTLNAIDIPGGFGLISCNTMLSDLGGYLKVRSVAGEGTEIQMWVPLAHGESE